eukprot:3032484-Amphidinium_carterae.1
MVLLGGGRARAWHRRRERRPRRAQMRSQTRCTRQQHAFQQRPVARYGSSPVGAFRRGAHCMGQRMRSAL